MMDAYCVSCGTRFETEEGELIRQCNKCGDLVCEECLDFGHHVCEPSEPPFKLSVPEVAKAIKLPVKSWPGKCYEIVCALAKTDLVEGTPRYGHWLGPGNEKCKVKSFIDKPFVRHGWMECDDVIIVDPTRWVFEAVKPYVYVGESDYYDMGGNQLREAMMRPAPSFDPSAKVVNIPFGKYSRKAATFVKKDLLNGTPKVTEEQAFWLANLPLSHFKGFAKPIYEALIAKDMGALIPIDNRRFVLQERD